MIDQAPEADFSPRAAIDRVQSFAAAGASLTRRRVLVLGAHSDIGAAIAVAIARAGAHVAIVYPAVARERGRFVASILRGIASTVAEVEGDLTDRDAAREVPRVAAAALDGLDVLVHTWTVTDADDPLAGDDVFATNMIAMVRVTRAALTVLGPGGAIVNTTSSDPHSSAPGRADATAMGAAAEGWTTGLAAELLGRGIRVNAIAGRPMPVVSDDTPFDPALGRALEELTRMSVQLAAAGSRFMTGETVRTDRLAATW